ncbi:protein yippee-like 5 isoform X3 [Ornithorhynchus anatinus]|uniref:protein yippee-like 5 isoform X3 n=1 Tax=Ornithorhynchus anatinus TaxID=9258 RepID=UPI0019D4EE74|nr:protein yippee-like 5 isoform X3 [Ornithorhynchus anatinus]
MLVTGATGVYGAIAEQRASWTRCRSDRSPFPPEKDRRRSSVPVVCLATSGYIGECAHIEYHLLEIFDIMAQCNIKSTRVQLKEMIEEINKCLAASLIVNRRREMMFF